MSINSRLVAKIEAEDSTQRLAVLIDADNAQAAVIEGLLAEIARFGEATVKRIYGDFTAPSSSSWKKVLNKFAIKPVQQFAYTTGKNATDSTMIIDAMDLLYTRRFEGFCIISSDSDFTGLALRIREEGLTVYGFGESKTPESFRNACHKFIHTELFRPIVDTTVATVSAQKMSEKSIIVDSLKEIESSTNQFTDAFFKQAVEQAGDESGWAQLGTFGSYLTKLRSDFDSRNFGYKKLGDLVKARQDIFQIEERILESSGLKVLYLKAK